MDFSTIKNWVIPEGNVTKVVDSSGIIIWQKEESSTWGNLIIRWENAPIDGLSDLFLRPITFADAASPILIDNYRKLGKGIEFDPDQDGYGTISFENIDIAEFTNITDVMLLWGTDYIYIGSDSGNPTSDFQFICAVEVNQLHQALNAILNGDGDQEVQVYWEQGQVASIKQPEGGLTASASSASISIYDRFSFGWSLTTEDSWITLSNTIGSGRTTVALSITANSNSFSRTGTILFKSLITGDTISTLTITQPGRGSSAPLISVTPTQISFDKNGGTNYITITSSLSWTLTVTPSTLNPDQTIMPTVSRTYGRGTTKIAVSRPALLNADLASGNVYIWTIQINASGNQAICEVIQDGALEL